MDIHEKPATEKQMEYSNPVVRKPWLDLVIWLISMAFLAGMAWANFETKTTASETYVRKDVMQETLKSIENELKGLRKDLEAREFKKER